MRGPNKERHSEVYQYDVSPELGNKQSGESKRTCIESRAEQEERTRSFSSDKIDKPLQVCALLKEV